MPTFTALAVAMAAAVQAGPSPAPADDEPFFLMSISSSPETCNLALATKVSLTDLARTPQTWAGKCVAVDGYWRHRALFDTAQDARTQGAQSGAALKGRRVGIYGTPELLSSAPPKPARYTAVGIAGTCDALAEGAIMVMGYCHYTGGAYIAVAEVHRR